MGRIKIKNITTNQQCLCRGKNAKKEVQISGSFSSPQATILLCDACFDELKKS